MSHLQRSDQNESLRQLMVDYRQRVDKALKQWLPAENSIPSRLHQAMHYSAFNGGKRVRPLLVYLTGRALGVHDEALDGIACAVEMIHAYSLIHDDLPAMDNDDLRRGKPTCHRAYDEATAILAGDALQPLAFSIIARDEKLTVSAETRIKMVEQLAYAAGSRGMVGGQAIDIDAVGKKLDIAQLEHMHIHKTGALIRASVVMGAMASAELTSEQLNALDQYSKYVGLAFQVQDDILDVEGSTEELGKAVGADAELEKPTYPAIIGLESAKERATQLVASAIDSLKEFGDAANPLRDLARYIIERRN